MWLEVNVDGKSQQREIIIDSFVWVNNYYWIENRVVCWMKNEFERKRLRQMEKPLEKLPCHALACWPRIQTKTRKSMTRSTIQRNRKVTLVTRKRQISCHFHKNPWTIFIKALGKALENVLKKAQVKQTSKWRIFRFFGIILLVRMQLNRMPSGKLPDEKKHILINHRKTPSRWERAEKFSRAHAPFQPSGEFCWLL
jgi:hypothetical protein